MPLTLEERALVLETVRPTEPLSDKEVEYIFSQFANHFSNKTPQGYSLVLSNTAIGVEHKFKGPGMPQHANGVHFIQTLNDWAQKCLADRVEAGEPTWGDSQARTVLSLLAQAFEAGRQASKAELRGWLGVPNSRF